jgi:hypothetical protein
MSADDKKLSLSDDKKSSLADTLYNIAIATTPASILHNRMKDYCNTIAKSGKFEIELYKAKNGSDLPDTAEYVYTTEQYDIIENWAISNKLKFTETTHSYTTPDYSKKGVRCGFNITYYNKFISYDLITISWSK